MNAERAHTRVQDELAAAAEGETVRLDPATYPREIAGPLVVRRGITLDGCGATVIAGDGPAVIIEAGHVSVADLIVESGDGRGVCLRLDSGASVHTHAVRVAGRIEGVPGETGEWHCPRVLTLGRLPHGTGHTFLVRLAVPQPCRIESLVDGVMVQPRRLTPGPHEVRVIIESDVPRDTLLHGALSVRTAMFERRILVSGHVVVGDGTQRARPGEDVVLWEPADWYRLIGPDPSEVSPEATYRVIAELKEMLESPPQNGDAPPVEEPPDLPSVLIIDPDASSETLPVESDLPDDGVPPAYPPATANLPAERGRSAIVSTPGSAFGVKPAAAAPEPPTATPTPAEPFPPARPATSPAKPTRPAIGSVFLRPDEKK